MVGSSYVHGAVALRTPPEDLAESLNTTTSPGHLGWCCLIKRPANAENCFYSSVFLWSGASTLQQYSVIFPVQVHICVKQFLPEGLKQEPNEHKERLWLVIFCIIFFFKNHALSVDLAEHSSAFRWIKLDGTERDATSRGSKKTWVSRVSRTLFVSNICEKEPQGRRKTEFLPWALVRAAA